MGKAGTMLLIVLSGSKSECSLSSGGSKKGNVKCRNAATTALKKRNPQQEKSANAVLNKTNAHPRKTTKPPPRKITNTPPRKTVASSPSPRNLLASPGKSLACLLCPARKPFTTFRSLQRHKAATHSSQVFDCEECNKCFNTEEKVCRHKKDVHNNDPQFQCKVCGKICRTSSALSSHERRHASIVCSTCGQSFTNKDELAKHSRQHSRFSCDQCDQTFTRRNDAKRHNIAVHGERSECVVCKKRVSGQMQAHFEKQHQELLKFIEKKPPYVA